MAKRKKSPLATKYFLAALILVAAAAIVGTSLYVANQQTSSEVGATDWSNTCFRACRSKCSAYPVFSNKRNRCKDNCRTTCDNQPPHGDYEPYPMPELPGEAPNIFNQNQPPSGGNPGPGPGNVKRDTPPNQGQ